MLLAQCGRHPSRERWPQLSDIARQGQPLVGSPLENSSNQTVEAAVKSSDPTGRNFELTCGSLLGKPQAIETKTLFPSSSVLMGVDQPNSVLGCKFIAFVVLVNGCFSLCENHQKICERFFVAYEAMLHKTNDRCVRVTASRAKNLNNKASVAHLWKKMGNLIVVWAQLHHLCFRTVTGQTYRWALSHIVRGCFNVFWIEQIRRQQGTKNQKIIVNIRVNGSLFSWWFPEWLRLSWSEALQHWTIPNPHFSRCSNFGFVLTKDTGGEKELKTI